MSDIVERLRTLHRMYSIGGTTLDEAADTITALRAQVSRMQELVSEIRPILLHKLHYMKEPESHPIIKKIDAALNQTKDTTDDA